MLILLVIYIYIFSDNYSKPSTLTIFIGVPLVMKLPSVTTSIRSSSISIVPEGRKSVKAVPVHPDKLGSIYDLKRNPLPYWLNLLRLIF